MSEEVYINKKGKMRVYDGTDPTPFYLEIDFDAGDFTGPLLRPRPEEKPVLDRGKMSANAHYIQGTDEVFMEGMPISFTALMTNFTSTGYLETWLLEVMQGVGTTVNSNTIVTTKGSTQNDGSNDNPDFADTSKVACNIEILWDGVDSDKGIQYNEVWIANAEAQEAPDGNTIAYSGFVFGTIARITSFTSGTDVTT